MQESDLQEIPFNCALAYLFLPYSILNCVGKTSTLFSNFLLAATWYSMSKNYMILCLFSLALEAQKNFYPLILIVPVALAFADRNSQEKGAKIKTTLWAIFLFAGIFAGLQYYSFLLMNGWQFLDSTYGFM